MTLLPITHLGARGDGVAGTFYVANSAPGDLVEVDDTGTVISVHPGPNRATPPCQHFGACGGCSLQHLSAASYAQWVSDRVVMALSQHRIVPRIIHSPHISPAGSRRRTSLKAVRKGKRVALGYNQQGTHALIDLQHCPVLSDAIVHIFTPLRKLLMVLLRDRGTAAIDITVCDSGLDMHISGLAALNLDTRMQLVEFAQAPVHLIARLTVDAGEGFETFVLNSTPTLHFDGIAVPLPPAAFTQATVQAELAMVTAVRSAVGESKTVADLFCGLGTFALPLSAQAEVHAVDGALLPVQALQQAARLHGRRITTEHRDLFRRPLTANELNGFDAVVFDPPRAGAEAQCRNLATSTVKTVVTVSCNPNTFARDAKILTESGYLLDTLWPIGQFLWSLHVEVVALFRRA